MRQPIDPELNYCPRCGDEYRADVHTCAACAVALVNGGQVLARQAERQRRPAAGLPENDTNTPVCTVRKGPLLQIKALQAYLGERDLPSRVTQEAGGACGCRGPEVLLQVRESDLAEVLQALDEEYRQSTGLSDHDTRLAAAVYDAEAAEATCPACGCCFATSLTVCPDCGLCFA